MSSLEIVLAFLAVVSAVVAFLSYTIAKQAVRGQFRPQLLLLIGGIGQHNHLEVKNISNSPATNIGVLIKGVVNEKGHTKLTTKIKEPNVLASGESRKLEVYFISDENDSRELLIENHDVGPTLYFDTYSHTDKEAIINYDDISGNSYRSIFTIKVNEITHNRTEPISPFRVF